MTSRAWYALLLASSSLLPPAGSSFAASRQGLDDMVYADSRLGPAFRRAVREAARRLESAPCRALLGDFADGRTGRPLEETLSGLGLSPSVFLLSIRFRSGEGDRYCADPRMAAYSSPGSRAVVVCPANGLGLRVRGGASTVTVVLHETLHSLGLRENPPSSEEITAAVQARCGD